MLVVDFIYRTTCALAFIDFSVAINDANKPANAFYKSTCDTHNTDNTTMDVLGNSCVQTMETRDVMTINVIGQSQDKVICARCRKPNDDGRHSLSVALISTLRAGAGFLRPPRRRTRSIRCGTVPHVGQVTSGAHLQPAGAQALLYSSNSVNNIIFDVNAIASRCHRRHYNFSWHHRGRLALLCCGDVEANPGPRPTTTAKSYINPSCRQMRAPQSFRIASSNVNSLRYRVNEIASLVNTYSIDILCLQETKLCDGVSDSELSITDYDIHRSDRNANGGGVAIYVKSCYAASRLVAPTTLNVEAVGIRLKCLGTTLNVISTYRTPSSNAANYYENLLDYLTHIICHESSTIVAGDTNVDASKQSNATIIQHFCDSLKLSQIVNTVTHKNSIIDHIYYPTTGLGSASVTLLSPIEKYHATILATMSITNSTADIGKKQRESSLPIRQWTKVNWDSLLGELSQLQLLSDVKSAPSVNDCWEVIKRACHSLITKHVPQGRQRRNCTPWFNRKIAKAIRQRDAAYRRWRASGNSAQRSEFLNLKKSVKKLVATSKRNRLSSIFDNATNPQQFWKGVRALTKSAHKCLPPITLPNGSVALTEQAKADALSAYYSSVIIPCNHPTPVLQETNDRESHTDFYCSVAWVVQKLRHLRSSKATGSDDIPAKFLRQTADYIGPALCQIINRSIETGKLPDEWKEARVVAIPKTAKATTVDQFRPISVLSTMSQIAERHVYNILYSHIGPQLPTFQYGFCRKRSTADALLHAELAITAGWSQCIKSKVPTTVAVVSLDLKKAFDSIPHHIIIERLINIGVPLPLLRWTHDFLSQRKQYVNVGASKSCFSIISCGVPQGSVLGPLLYIAATSTLKLVQLSPNATIILYADDTILIKPIINRQDNDDLNQDLRRLTDHFQELEMSLNIAKTQVMVASVARSPTPHHDIVDILLEQQQLTPSSTLKYLGILLDQSLSFLPHIKSVTGRVRRMLGSLRSTLQRNKQFRSIGRIYASCIRPVMLYALPLLEGVSKSGDDMFHRIDKLAARMASNQPELSLEHIKDELGWSITTKLAEEQRLRLMSQVASGSSSLAGLFQQCTTRHSNRRFKNTQLYLPNLKCASTRRANRTCLYRACIQWNNHQSF